MIRFENVDKQYRTRTGSRTVLRDASFTIGRGEALAICGQNGAGKSTLLRLIAGVESPTQGRISRDMRVSWPIGHGSAFQSSLTGADNAKFVARIYHRPVDDMLAFVDDFAELGSYLRMPVRTYSAGMMARLAFAVSLAVDFDCYLVDEITSAGDARFQQRCHDALLARRESGTLVMVSHDDATLRRYCDKGATLIDGRLVFHDNLEDAIASHLLAQHGATA
jgi:capsular polysaccharide transport system ATP-binding protein